MPRVFPEFVANENEDNDSEDSYNTAERKRNENNSTKSTGPYVGSIHAQRRQQIKDKILQEVVSKVLPDMGAFNFDDLIYGKKEVKRHWFVTFLMTLGIIDISCQEAVIVGSIEKLSYNLVKNTMSPECDKSLPNSRDESGRTLLIMALQVERPDMVKKLLEFEADPNIPDEEYGMSPLCHSVICQQLSSSHDLFKYNADVNIADKRGVTPLMMACAFNDTMHCTLHLEHAAIVDSVDCNGWTALHYCAFANADVCACLLLDEGADREITDLHNRKALHIAQFKEYGDVIAVLEDYESRLH